MKIDKINFYSQDDYIHMERYINCGSPSGFTEIHNTSPTTRPMATNQSFYLCSIDLPGNIIISDFGEQPLFFQKYQMLIHPDLSNDKLLSICPKLSRNALLVAPMSSARTVKMLTDEGWFLKLNYKGIIGRIDRQISKKHALSAIESSKIIEKHIDKHILPNNFYFQRELFARVVDFPNNDSNYEWGIVVREPQIYPKNEKIKYCIPAFSLFSRDQKFPDDPTILIQLIEHQHKSVDNYLFDDIISPILSCYFSIIINCGLQLECHAQNTLLAISDQFQILGIVARDAESIDRDLPLMRHLGIDSEVTCRDYKCLDENDYNYNIMHSFMFDFKLGKYLLMPIIEEAYKNLKFDKQKLLRKIKEFTNSLLKGLPGDFFPVNGKWYSYDNIVHDRTKKRPYIAKDKPDFR